MTYTETAPTPGAVTGTELSRVVQDAVDAALNRQEGERSAPSAKMAQDYPVPEDELLAKIHSWALSDGAKPPSKGEVIQLAQDGSVELISNSELERRMAVAEMAQPSLAGLVAKGDELGKGLPIVGKVPWGAILFGTVPGAIVSEVVDGLMAPRNADGSLNFGNIAIKVGIAGAGMQFGSKFVGTKASGFFAAGLLLFVFADVLPVDAWVAKAVSALKRGGIATQGQDAPSSSHGQGADHRPLTQTGGDDALDTLRGFAAQGLLAA